MRVGGIGLAAQGKNPQHLVIKQYADFNEIGIADGVDPERAIDLFSKFRRQDVVEYGEERLRTGGGQGLKRQDGHVERQSLVGNLDEFFKIVRLRIGFDHADDGRDIARRLQWKVVV